MAGMQVVTMAIEETMNVVDYIVSTIVTMDHAMTMRYSKMILVKPTWELMVIRV